MVTPELWSTIQKQGDAETRANWAKRHTPFFTTDADSKIELDEDLQAIGMGFDDAQFLDSTTQQLASSNEAERQRAMRLLSRYVPDGPSSGKSVTWRTWHRQNEPYLFATDFGHYRWYIDPLAKRRGVATSQLRGIARMDQ